MKKVFVLLNLALLVVMLITPAMAMAGDGKTITVYAPTSTQPATEKDILNYLSLMFTTGYINETHYCTQSTYEDRMSYLKETAVKGFNPDTDDPFIWTIMMPNSANAENITTWFGHPVVKDGDRLLIKGWFTNNTDAEVMFIFTKDIRTGL